LRWSVEIVVKVAPLGSLFEWGELVLAEGGDRIYAAGATSWYETGKERGSD